MLFFNKTITYCNEIFKVNRCNILIVAIYEIYCNENLVLHKPIASGFITMACIDYFIVAITPITTTLVVIATTFFVVLSLFSCSEYKYLYVLWSPVWNGRSGKLRLRVCEKEDARRLPSRKHLMSVFCSFLW